VLKPKRLRPGDTVAAISLSSGLASLVPHRYLAGKSQIEATFSLKVIHAPNALRDPEWLYRNPKARAEDLHWALENSEVRALFSTIGGDESVRILPFVDPEHIRRHPKILMGFSDTTVALSAFLRAGLSHFMDHPSYAILRRTAAFDLSWRKRCRTHCSKVIRFRSRQQRVGPNSYWTGAALAISCVNECLLPVRVGSGFRATCQ
jgi:muramoyltetrapeptide carboxypeptidase LdcA involved in peptidoglycan recycling